MLSRTAYIWNVADLTCVGVNMFDANILVGSEASALDICHYVGVHGEPERDFADDAEWAGYTRRGVVDGLDVRVTSMWRK